MELRVIDGLAPNGWIFDRLPSLWNDIAPSTPSGIAPATDVVEDADGYHFYFEMPGLRAESVDVRVAEGRLIAEAERKAPQWPKDASVHLRERSYGTIRRAFRLPEDAAHDGVTAKYRDGVLEVVVPKRPESKPVKIQVSFVN
ncbi:MAG: Hsp20/alpha crystallin family protein [Candidatus Binataceae bacterium]